MRLMLPLIILAGLLGISLMYDKPQGRAELNLSYISIETLDPQLMRASADIRVGYGLFEGLCTYDPYTFTVEPGVAKRWDVSEDGRRYTFYLRDDARWSNGDRVTANDFVAAWRQGLMPDVAPSYIEFLFFIKGGRDYYQWCSESLKDVKAKVEGITDKDERLAIISQRVAESKRKFEQLVGVTVVDELTLVVQLERPVPYFLDIAAMWPLFPLHGETLEENTSVDSSTCMLRRDPQWTKAGRMISNGPYRLKRWRFKREILLEANEYYWNKEIVGPKSVKLINFKDAYTEFMAYETGALELLLETTVEFRADIIEKGLAGERGASGGDVHGMSAFGTYYFPFNCMDTLADGSQNPLSDWRVRKALAMTVDKGALVRDVTRLHQEVARTFIPPGSIVGYQSPKGLGCISDAKTEAAREKIISDARQLLADANFPADMKLQVIYNTGGGHENQVQAIAQMWKRYLDIDVETEALEWKVYFKRRREGGFHVARAGWFGDYGDPTTYLDLFKTDNGNNDSGFSDPKFDGLLAQAEVTVDPEKRMEILSRAEAYVTQEMIPILPLYQYKLVDLYDPEKLKGVSSHPRHLQMFHRMEVID